ncbi:MFS transporter [Actinokineospora sp. HUAS TT18]|uniref:MFS transporter n=1 Tax=Actinokineospora sp. HUAS TT18 TaxID=3447451 RepID=UPI003F528FBF
MLGRRDLLLVASGSAVSMFGTAVTLIVLLLHAKDFGSYAVVAVLIAEFVPVTLGAPFAGLLVDRLPNRRLMIIGQLVQAGAVIGVVAVLNTLPLVLVMLVLLGCGTAVVNPAAAAMVPVICGEKDSTRGYAIVATGRTLGMLGGSAAGGLLVAAFGTRDALYLDAATYLIQAALLGFVRVDRDPRGAQRRRRHGDALAGLRHVARDPVLRVASVSLAVALAGVMVADVANVFYVTDVLHGGAATLGILHAAWMTGVFVGVRVAGRSSTERALLTGLGLSCCGMGVAMLIPSLLPFTVPVALGYVLGGIANGVQNVSNQGLLRSRTPEHLRGRVFATAAAILIGSNVLGTVLGGAVVMMVGARQAFAIAGVASLIAGFAAFRALRAVDTTKPASVT